MRLSADLGNLPEMEQTEQAQENLGFGHLQQQPGDDEQQQFDNL